MTSVKEKFLSLLDSYENIENFSGPLCSCNSARDERYQAYVTETIEGFQQVKRMVEQLDLFSLNEDLDDVATGDMPYLLLPALLSNLISRISVKEQANNADGRLNIVHRAIRLQREFLCQAEQYDFVSALDKKMIQTSNEYVDDDDNDNDENRSNSSRNVNNMKTSFLSREEKIQRYKNEKELEDRVKQWRGKMGKIIVSIKSSDDDDDNDADQITSYDEDEYRSVVESWIRLFVQKSIDSLASLVSEAVILKTCHDRKENANRDSVQDVTERLKTTTITKDHVRGMQGPQIFDSKKMQFLDRVFKPGYNLPTMTLDEFYEREMERGNFLSGGGKVPIPEDEDDEKQAIFEHKELDDDDYMREKRREDEWKAENPRGSGNRYNRS